VSFELQFFFNKFHAGKECFSIYIYIKKLLARDKNTLSYEGCSCYLDGA